MLSSFSTGEPEPDLRKYATLPEFLEYVWLGDLPRIRMVLDNPLARERFLDGVDPVTGMNALHIAVGRNNLEIAKLLVEAGITFIPDNEGRMPSLIAALCDVSEELVDYILDAEGKAISPGDTDQEP
jgi:hypothetical protein